MPTDSYTVIIPGEPVAKGRPRFVRATGRTYTPEKTVSWTAKAWAVMISTTGGAEPLSGPLLLEFEAVFSCPKSDHRKREPRKRRWHEKKPDLDNVLKAIKDAGNKVLWHDDSQIAIVAGSKIIGAQDEAPRVSLTVYRQTTTPGKTE